MNMGWARTRSLTIGAVILLLVSACGGGGDGSSTSTETPAGAGAQANDQSTDAGTAKDDTGADEAQAPSERSAVITVDGESTKYALDDVVWSPVEGVADATFETCSPDFFGSGRFYAIGYAVDDNGELILGDGDQPGSFTMDLPPDDWEATQRDAPGFDITFGDLDIEIASPEQAAGGTMKWTIDDTRASGTAVFVDYENTYTVDFEVICEGEPTVDVGALPDDNAGDSGGATALSGAGVGSFVADGEAFDGVDVYSCEPFSFGDEGPNPEDLSLLAFLGGSNGLEIEVTHSPGYDLSDGSQFDQITFSAFFSRQGADGLQQFEGSATNDASGAWSVSDDTGQQTGLAEPPFVIQGDRISGGLTGLDQTWPDEGADIVDVTFDFQIPDVVNDSC